MSKYGVFSGPSFPVFSPNTGKYGPEKTPYLDSFHAVQTIGNSILSFLQRNDINISNCRPQAYNGASAISSDRCGTVSVLKKEPPLAEYTHCKNHILSLAIRFACENQSIRKCMDNLTTLCFFFENSPKRQSYLENFIEFYREKLNLSETRCKKIIGLSKTRWVERHKAYETYILLFKATVLRLESICKQQLYEEFYESLENKHNEKWI